MVSVNAILTDNHENQAIVDANITVLNYFNDTYGVETNILFGGDYSSKDSSQGAARGDLEAKILENQQLDDKLARHKGNNYGVLGNHDHPLTSQVMSNIEFLEDGEVYDIGGVKFMSYTHFSGHMFESEKEHTAKINKKIPKYKENVKKADFSIGHESPLKGERAPESTKPHKELGQILEIISGFGGHKHHSKVNQRENGTFFARGYAEKENGLSFYQIVQNDGSIATYQIENKYIIRYAELIDEQTNQNKGMLYHHKDVLKQKEQEVIDFKAYVTKQNPNFFTEREEASKRIRKIEREFLKEQKEKGVSKNEIERAELFEKIDQEYPTYFVEQERHQEEAVRYQREWENMKAA